MKKATMLKIIGVLLGFSLIGSIAGAVAWFNPIANISVEDNPIEGTTEGAYFAYGDGTTKAKAYGITKPRHLYNLAWLTYLGYFKDKQCYFELANNISMEGWTIPPIGTSEHPFFGDFDGKGFVVSNCSISNKYSDYGSKHPGTVTGTNFQPNVIKVVGFFGIVGNYNETFEGTYDSQINTVHDLGLTTISVKTYSEDTLVGMFAGYVDANVSNIAVDVGTIDISTDEVTAFNSSYTSRISDYGIIGYTTKKKKISKFSDTTYGVSATTCEPFSVEEQGTSAAWGGSINMQKIYTNLNTIWRNTGNAAAIGTRTETHDKFGHLESRTETTTGSAVLFPYGEYENRFSSEGTDQHYYVNKEIQTDSKVSSSFSFVKRSNDSDGQFISITGDRDILTNGNNTTTVTTDKYAGNLIKIQNSNNHFSHTGTTINNQTDPQSASLWSLNNSGAITTLNNTSVYYLKCDASGNLSLVNTNPSIVWSYDPSIGYNVTVSGTRYALGFNGSNWVTTTVEGGWYYIRSGTNYLGTNLSRVSNPSQRETNTGIRWYKLGNYFGIAPSSTTYLGATQNEESGWFSTTYTYTINNSASNYIFSQNGNKLTFNAISSTGGWFSSGDTYSDYYVRYNNNQFSCSTTFSDLTIEQQATTFGTNINSTSVIIDSNTHYRYDSTSTYTTQRFVHSYPTYWPLKNIGDETETTGDDVFGSPAAGNTGYIVGGANYTGDPSGDIRFSNYSGSHRQGANGSTTNPPGAAGYSSTKASLRNSYTPGSDSFTSVYTINDSGKTDIIGDLTAAQRKAQYPKYEKAAAKLINNLKTTYSGGSSGEIPGLHFMDTNIAYGVHDGIDQSAYVESAKIFEKNYTHYEVPTTCIDFNLKDSGRITFFAGTYFWGNTTGNRNNNSFFSLHTVERFTQTDVDAAGENDDVRLNGIKAVREIEIIYKLKNDESSPYVYKFSDDTYSVTPFNEANYDVVFKTSWIKKQTSLNAEKTNPCVYLLDAAYYFEIPVNAGEYALGSVLGGDGGYLMYLDIGANAALLNRATFGQKHITIQSDYEVPLGVAYLPTSSMQTALTAGTSNPAQSEFISIYEGSGGDITLTQSSSTSADLTVSTAGLSIKAAYIYDQITLHDPGGDAMDSTPLLKTTTTVQETLYCDYNAVLNQTTKTAVVVTQVATINDFGETTSTGPTRSYWQLLPGESERETDTAKITFFESESGKKVTNFNNMATQEALTSTLLTFTFMTENGVTATVSMELTTSVNSTTHYHEITGYKVSVVDGSGNPLEVTGVGVTINSVDGVQTVSITLSDVTYTFQFNIPAS